MIRPRSIVRRSAAALLLVFALSPSTGCEIAGVRLLIPDFESAEVSGLQLWVLDLSSGDYRESQRIEFGEILSEDGGETLVYSVWKKDEQVAPFLAAVVERGGSDDIALRVLLPSLARGLYRVSSLNAAGGSELSQDYFAF